MKSANPVGSVVIPTCRRASSLRQCLDSLLKQSYENFEVIVVECDSDVETARVVKDYSSKLSLRLVTQGGGLIHQMDVGFRLSHGDIVIRTDDDVIADRQWLSEIVSTFSRSNDIGGVSGPTLIPLERLPQRDVFMLLPDGRKSGWLSRAASSVYVSFFVEGQPHAVGRVFKSGAWSPGSNFPRVLEIRELVEVDYLEACNMAVRRNLIEAAGWLDFTYKSIAEWSEVELSFRIRNLGYRLVFNPRAIVHHMVSRSGVYVQREAASDRMMNLVYFYFTHIGPDTVDKYLRFFSYLAMLQGYWFFKFISTGNKRYLSGIAGTARGLSYNLKNSIRQRG